MQWNMFIILTLYDNFSTVWNIDVFLISVIIGTLLFHFHFSLSFSIFRLYLWTDDGAAVINDVIKRIHFKWRTYFVWILILTNDKQNFIQFFFNFYRWFNWNFYGLFVVILKPNYLQSFRNWFFFFITKRTHSVFNDLAYCRLHMNEMT